MQKNKKSITIRLMKELFSFYPVMLPLVIVFIIFNAIVSSIPAVFHAECHRARGTELAERRLEVR